jgi:hypothetical protein
MILRISRTKPFRDYQGRVGNAIYLINTIAVGLELVAEGGEKPSPFHIKWQRPSDPRQTANRARTFALVAIMNLAFDSFDVYLRNLGRLPWLPVPPEVGKVLRKDGSKAGGKDYSEAERSENLIEHLGKEDPGGLIAMLDLSAKWRTKLVHAEADPDIIKRRADELLSREEVFARNYAGLSVSKLLANFRAHANPTLKEATSLIAASMNLARFMDEAVISAAAADEKGMLTIAQTILSAYLLIPGKQSSEATQDHQDAGLRPSAVFKETWSSDHDSRIRKLIGLLRKGGMTDSPDGMSATLDSHFLEELASMSRDKAFDFLNGFRGASVL